MKREALLRHLRRCGCIVRREGKEHSIWENPLTGHAEAVPRHVEIANLLVKRICRKLSIAHPPGLEGQRILRDIRRSHVEEFAYLVTKLKSIPEGSKDIVGQHGF